MATLPAEGRWSIRTLPEDGIESALEFLRRDPLVNVYLIARLIEERTLAASQMVEVRFNRDIVPGVRPLFANPTNERGDKFRMVQEINNADLVHQA